MANEIPLPPSVDCRAQCGDRAVSQFLPGVEALGNRQLAQLCSDTLAAARRQPPSPLHLQPGYLQGQPCARLQLWFSPGPCSAQSLRVLTRVPEQAQPWLQAGKDGPHQMGMLSISCPSLQSEVCLRVGILQLFYRDLSSPLVLWRGQRDCDPMLCLNPLIPNNSLSSSTIFTSHVEKNLSLDF